MKARFYGPPLVDKHRHLAETPLPDFSRHIPIFPEILSVLQFLLVFILTFDLFSKCENLKQQILSEIWVILTILTIFFALCDEKTVSCRRFTELHKFLY